MTLLSQNKNELRPRGFTLNIFPTYQPHSHRTKEQGGGLQRICQDPYQNKTAQIRNTNEAFAVVTKISDA